MAPRGYPLVTPRLVLRALVQGDAEVIYHLRSVPENLHYVDMVAYRDVSRAARFIDRVMRDVSREQVYFWGMEEEASGTLVGTICLWSFSEDRKWAEVGYELLPDHKKRGFMTEALTAILSFSKEKIGLEGLRAITHPAHTASIDLLTRHHFLYTGKVGDLYPGSEDNPEMSVYERVLSEV